MSLGLCAELTKYELTKRNIVDFSLFVRFVDHLPTSALRNCVPIHFSGLLLYLSSSIEAGEEFITDF